MSRTMTCTAMLSAALLLWAVPSAAVESRGQMLYEHHCVACHTTQMHWRDRKLVTDWASLKAQVRRFQGAAELNWSETDVDDVARYLNNNFYHLPGGARLSARGWLRATGWTSTTGR
jgi:mono/diheme cytochrome c family protein